MIATLLILGGAVFGVLSVLHTIYTLLDLRNPRRLAPVDPSVAHAMANSALRLSGGRTDMWRAWIGFNFSHSLALIMLAAADESLAHDGMSPHRISDNRRTGSLGFWRITGTGWSRGDVEPWTPIFFAGDAIEVLLDDLLSPG
jgi:hypothetical protein